jgi:hypothetical protein
VEGKGREPAGARLPFTLPVRMQLVTSDGGVCWETVYAPGSRSTGTATTFKGGRD